METDIIIVINGNNIIFCTKLIELIILYFHCKSYKYKYMSAILIWGQINPQHSNRF